MTNLTLEDKIKLHKQSCQIIHTIYKDKQHDYGDSFGKTFEALGPISAVTRISDKFNRLCNLITRHNYTPAVDDESIVDTLYDMANYCLMTAIELTVEKYKNMEEEEE